MATSAAQADTTRALVLHDPRPFLAQAIDRCLEFGMWDVADLEVFTVDVVNMAFRYRKHQQQDIRDLDAVGEAAEIVCMYIDDGLRTLSGNNLTRAAELLSTDGHALLHAFQRGWGTLDQLRKRAAQFQGDLRNILVGPPGHTIALHPIPHQLLEFGSGRGLKDYTDVELIAAWRRGMSVAVARERFCDGIALVERQYALLQLLPFNEVTRNWRKLLIADGTFSIGAQGAQVSGLAYDMGWSSTFIRAVEHGDVGLVVTTRELARFLARYLESDDEGAFVSEGAIEIAVAVLAPWFTAALGRPADADVRYALEHAARHIEAVDRPSAEEDDGAHEIVSRSGQWIVEWGVDAVFLAVSRKEHDRAVESIVGPMGQDELVERFEGAVVPLTTEERTELLQQMDLATMPVEDLGRVLEASPQHVKTILCRSALAKRPVEDLEAFATSDVSLGLARHHVAEAILRASNDLSCLSDSAVFALLLNLPPTPQALRTLLRKARMTPERLLSTFRGERDSEVRQDWVRLAAASGEHLTYLIGDVFENPRFAADIAEAFRGKCGDLDCVWIPPGVTADCFLEIEQAARRAAGRAGGRANRQQGRQPLLDGRGEPKLLDPDLRWLWPKLSTHQQDAVRKAFRKASTTANPRRKPAKKPARPRRKNRS